MAIQERLLEFKYHLALGALLAAAVLYVLTLGPSLSTVVGFFWPLLLSTGFFLAAVALLLRISPPTSDASADITGEKLMDYVTSHTAEASVKAEEEEEMEDLAEHREPGGGGGEAREAELGGEMVHPKSQ